MKNNTLLVIVALIGGLVLLGLGVLIGQNLTPREKEENSAADVLDDLSKGIKAANDATSREEANIILDAVTLYIVDNSGNLPTVNGQAMPVVNSNNVMQKGVNATLLDRIVPDYLTNIPTAYYIGVQENGAVLVATTLSDGATFTVSE